MLLFLTGARLLKLPKILHKNEVIHPSSYSMIMFKELYNKVPEIKKCAAEIFGQSCFHTMKIEYILINNNFNFQVLIKIHIV